ncbi:unnamed protein product [Toxocara canis]|uniref:G protein-coupled receptor n=1 Tax=Toxocara canis TaxID=6265 RepID=A0A183V8U4_TOXCA|nr:unnamed protein product [Toxocara canis]
MLTAATLSDPTRRLQKEVTTGMILQAVLPLVFNTLPMVCLLFLIISPIEIDCYGTLLFALLYWQPCVHPLLSLYFVRPFREVIVRRIIFVKPNNTGTTVVRSEMFKKSYFPSRMHR